MTPTRRHIALAAILVLLMACSLPLRPRTAAPAVAATLTARAGLLQPSATAGPSSLPVTGATEGTQVSVSSPTNCRSGPSTDYDLVFMANPGASFQVIGKYTAGNYWIINSPAGGACWLWGQYASVSGDTASLQEFPPPPGPGQPTDPPQVAITATATNTAVPPPPPAAPTNLQQSHTCTQGQRGSAAIWVEDVTLTWRDTAGEMGYRIYQNGAAISAIVQNSRSYQIELRYDQAASGTPSDNFGVEAYNNGGASPRPSVDVPRCP